MSKALAAAQIASIIAQYGVAWTLGAVSIECEMIAEAEEAAGEKRIGKDYRVTAARVQLCASRTRDLMSGP